MSASSERAAADQQASEDRVITAQLAVKGRLMCRQILTMASGHHGPRLEDIPGWPELLAEARRFRLVAICAALGEQENKP